MRVLRNFQDPELVRQLETMPERAIKARMAEGGVDDDPRAALDDIHDAVRRSGVVLTEEEIQAEIDEYRREKRASEAPVRTS